MKFTRSLNIDMKSTAKYLFFTVAIICLLSGSLAAKNLYVSGITKITMRTGPGVEHKIVTMLKSGTKLTVIEYQKDWSRVKTDDEKSGWVLSRFLTEDVPQTLLVLQLQKENQRLIKALENVEKKNKGLAEKNTSLEDIESKYIKLQKASAEFLELNAKYKGLLTESQDQKEEIKNLQANMGNEEKLWFLSGAGVFLLGMIIGLASRKKKRSSLL